MVRAIAKMALACLLPLIAACSDAPERGPTVLAPASMQEALAEVADAWAEDGHDMPVLSFAGTPALARQVEAGAPADIIVTADSQWMDELARRNLVRHRTRTTLATNSLVLVAPAESDAQIATEDMAQLRVALDSDRLAMADPDTVPAGRYARQALTKLDAWPGLADRITRTENVRVALALVARGEAPLGIVYATDARAEPGVRVVARFPESSHAPIAYPAALLARAGHPQAEALLAFLTGPEAEALLARHGFTQAGGQ